MIAFDARPFWSRDQADAGASRVRSRVLVSIGLLGAVVATLLAAGGPLP